MEDSENWPRIRQLLDVALELPAEKREEYVEGECPDDSVRRQVFSILAAYAEDTSFLERRPALPTLSGAGGNFRSGDRLGPYQLIEKMGEGGMGAVYLARRDDASFDKLVAIKLLKRGWASAEEIRRFRVERQILADLEHPNIAKLLDGGSAPNGQPYLVMEFVEGEPVDLYCRTHKLALDARLRLFLEICAAVQFAHQNLIVHRDLKPGNILVDREGRPRLLDFGIAKILSPENFSEEIEATEAGSSPMTPQYASPEQIRGGAITTASDVYSLGVILYRLLTGLAPYSFDSRDLRAVVEAVCHQEVLPPSLRLRQHAEPGADPAGPQFAADLGGAKRLQGDLDAIVTLALAKDPARRYATAEQFADDIRRHLARQPVRARAGTFSYRVGRFLHRHRLGLGSAMAVFLTLVASVLVLLHQQEELIDEKNRALRERNRSETVSSWLLELFSLPDPGRSLGEKVTARELLDKSRASIEQELAGEPELLATLLATLGETYSNLGQLKEARDLYSSALTHQRRTGADAQRLAVTLFPLADVLSQQGRYLAAQKVALSAHTHAVLAFGEGNALVVRCQTLLAYLEFKLGEWSRAAASFEAARLAARRLNDQAVLSSVLDYCAEFEQLRGDFDRSIADYREALELRRGLKGPDHPESVLLEGKLLFVLANREPVKAEAELRQVIARQRKLYAGDPNPVLSIAINNLGLLALGQGKVDEAKASFEEARAIAREVYGDSHPTLAVIFNNLGKTAARSRDWTAAENAYEQAIAILQRESGDRNPVLALMTSNLGAVKMSQGKVAEAKDLLAKALELSTATVSAAHPQNLHILNNLGELARTEGRLEDARELYLQAAAIGRRQPGALLPDLPIVLLNLAATEFLLGNREAARENFAEVEQREHESLLGLHAATYLARIDCEAGRPAAAAEWARQAIAGLEKAGPAEAAWVSSARRWLGRSLLAAGHAEAAEKELRLRLEILERSGAAADMLTLARQDLDEAEAARRAAAAPDPGERRKEP